MVYDNVVCDKVVCVCVCAKEAVWQRWCVTKMCERWCVTKDVCQKWCVTKLYVKDVVCDKVVCDKDGV